MSRTPRGSRGGGEAVTAGSAQARRAGARTGRAGTAAPAIGLGTGAPSAVVAWSGECFMTAEESSQSSHAGWLEEHAERAAASHSGMVHTGVRMPASTTTASASEEMATMFTRWVMAPLSTVGSPSSNVRATERAAGGPWPQPRTRGPAPAAQRPRPSARGLRRGGSTGRDRARRGARWRGPRTAAWRDNARRWRARR